MASVLISGGTGLIGTALSRMLIDAGHTVSVLTRKERPAGNNIRYVRWDIENQFIDESALGRVDHIVHLAGEGIADKRWSTARKKEILESRTRSSALLVKYLRMHAGQVKSVVSASAIGWYGADPVIPNPRPFTEPDPAADNFLGHTCKAWEDSISAAKELSRLVILRTGIVLSEKGGAMKEFLKPVKFGVASILGSGRQIVSWVHIDDLCRIYMRALFEEKMNGVYNAVAPAPVSNAELMTAIAQKKKGRFYIPVHVPAFVLRTVFGELSIEVLKSATVSSRRLQSEGFQFIYPGIEPAIENLVG